MADVYSKETRSYVMSKIKGKDTKPEILVRKFLHTQGFRFRLHVKKLPGTPDLFLRKYNTAIFVHGCFWHGHQNCKVAHIPKTRTEYWQTKIQKNIERDSLQVIKLTQLGLNVITIWECQLKATLMDNLIQTIKTSRPIGTH